MFYAYDLIEWIHIYVIFDKTYLVSKYNRLTIISLSVFGYGVQNLIYAQTTNNGHSTIIRQTLKNCEIQDIRFYSNIII